eukprot:131981-Chlamydomonas_euryale.AAC.3
MRRCRLSSVVCRRFARAPRPRCFGREYALPVIEGLTGWSADCLWLHCLCSAGRRATRCDPVAAYAARWALACRARTKPLLRRRANVCAAGSFVACVLSREDGGRPHLAHAA